MINFKVGDRVVCIDMSGLDFDTELKKNRVYIIDYFFLERVHFKGIKGGFFPRRFRKYNKPKDIDFRALLKKRCRK